MSLVSDLPPGFAVFGAVERGSSTLAHAARVFVVLFIAVLGLQALDPRMINGIDVWVKPAKFFLSISLQMATLAWGLSLLNGETIRRYRLKALAVLFVVLSTLEMAYMIYRASRGEASHFNYSSQLAELLYNLMGMAALGMMAITAWIGLALIRRGNPGPLATVTGASFIAAAIMTSVVGMYLGSQTSHWIGGDQTDATGLPLFGWSTTGGDLRPAHFMAMHVMQVAPALAILWGPRAGWVGLVFSGLATLALFLQAVSGMPLLPL